MGLLLQQHLETVTTVAAHLASSFILHLDSAKEYRVHKKIILLACNFAKYSPILKCFHPQTRK